MHFPIDIVTSALIAVLFLPIAILLAPLIRRWIYPIVEEVYERGIDLIRLPAVIFPRKQTWG